LLNLLADERLALFVTLVYEILLQDPDLEAARFQIIDLSAIKPGEKRSLRVIDAADIPRLPAERVRAMLEVFAEGYFRAQAELASKPSTDSKESDGPHPDQYDFFDPLGKR